MISVLIPCFNNRDYVETAIRSVLDQDCPVPVEILVQDDGSTDGSSGILAAMAASCPTVRLERWENQGVSAARNRMIQRLDPGSCYVTFLDADDQMTEGRLARDHARLVADPAAALVYSRMRFVHSTRPDMTGETDKMGPIFRGVQLTTTFFRRSALDLIGDFRVGMTHGEDLDFLMRAFEQDLTVIETEDLSLLYRQHVSAMSDTAKVRRGFVEVLRLHAQRVRQNPALRVAAGRLDFGYYLNETGPKS